MVPTSDRITGKDQNILPVAGKRVIMAIKPVVRGAIVPAAGKGLHLAKNYPSSRYLNSGISLVLISRCHKDENHRRYSIKHTFIACNSYIPSHRLG